MDMFGTVQFKTSRERLWQAFSDPSLMRSCIPGCDHFEWNGNERAMAFVSIAARPLAATFKSKFSLFDVQAPVTCTIAGDADGGSRGFATGLAKVRLEEIPGGTEVSYFAEARLCRKLSRFGSHRVEAAAKGLAERFFANLRQIIEIQGQTVPDRSTNFSRHWD